MNTEQLAAARKRAVDAIKERDRVGERWMHERCEFAADVIALADALEEANNADAADYLAMIDRADDLTLRLMRAEDRLAEARKGATVFRDERDEARAELAATRAEFVRVCNAIEGGLS